MNREPYRKMWGRDEEANIRFKLIINYLETLCIDYHLDYNIEILITPHRLDTFRSIY